MPFACLDSSCNSRYCARTREVTPLHFSARLAQRLLLVATAAVFAGCATLTADDQALQPTTFLGGKVTLLLPKSFVHMDGRIVKLMYPDGPGPNVVFSNPRLSAIVAVRYPHGSLPSVDMEASRSSLEASYRTLYPSADWIRSGVKSINGHLVIVVEMLTSTGNSRLRCIILCTPVDGRPLFISFEVPGDREDDWLPIGRKITESVATG